MPTAKITELIDKRDNVEIVRDELGAILLLESANQQQLAAVANKNPKDWAFRVFTERSNPWAEWVDRPDSDTDEESVPIVNIWFDKSKVDLKGSNVIEQQKYEGTFNLDCYGYGVSTATLEGHDPGDARAAFEAHRAARLVRNILMAGHYTYLGMRGVVGGRMVDGQQAFQPQIDARPSQHVVGLRIALLVEFNEFSPQVQGQPLELVSVSVVRGDNGEITLFETQFPYGE